MAQENRPERRDLMGNWQSSNHIKSWPDGIRLVVSVVVNVEEGAELSIADGDERNESLYEVREEVVDYPDLCMESHFGYGPRRGYQRIADILDEFGVAATFSTCGRAAQRLPWLLQDAVARGHEISAHGWRWERHADMDIDHERKLIHRTFDAITTASGTSPVGWHTRSSASVNTRKLLVNHGGFAYDSDAYDDDMPRTEHIDGTPHIVLPYSFDTNDMRFAPGAGFVHAEDFSRYVIAAFDQLYAEGEHELRMLSIGLHLRTIGKPARIVALRKILQYLCTHEDILFSTRRNIATMWHTMSTSTTF